MIAKHQKDRVLELLRIGPKSTIELRNAGIIHPAGRVLELRADGYKIDTAFIARDLDHSGFEHHGIAKYVLKQGVTNESN